MSLPETLPFFLPGPPAAPFDNLGYEIEGVQPGEAESWTSIALSTAEREATWGTASPPDDSETFESEWTTGYLFAFEQSDLDVPVFDDSVSEGEGFEDFEEGWDSNQFYSFELSAISPALFDSGAEEVETFDGWDPGYLFALGSIEDAAFVIGAFVPLAANALPGHVEIRPISIADFPDAPAPLVLFNGLTTEVVQMTGTDTVPYDRLVLGAPIVGTFNAGPSSVALGSEAETFEGGWDTNEDYLVEFVGVGTDLTAATFDTSEFVEDFEECYSERSLTVDAGTDTLTANTAHALAGADSVRFRAIGSSQLPGGLSSAFDYIVITATLTSDDFQVSVVGAAGAAVDLLDPGIGTFVVQRDRRRFWILPLA